MVLSGYCDSTIVPRPIIDSLVACIIVIGFAPVQHIVAHYTLSSFQAVIDMPFRFLAEQFVEAGQRLLGQGIVTPDDMFFSLAVAHVEDRII